MAGVKLGFLILGGSTHLDGLHFTCDDRMILQVMTASRGDLQLDLGSEPQ
jgi:hypothetical protein